MQKYILILFLIFTGSFIIAQSSYQLSAFTIKHDAIIKGINSHTKGLSIQFKFSPRILTDTLQQFSVEIKSKEHRIAYQEQSFRYRYTDNIAQLVDSLGIDSVDNLDTIIQLYIPYREIAIEEGNHDTYLTIFVKGKGLPVYNRPFRLQQVKTYDLFLDLKTATIIPDSNANPVGLGYNAPDPKWIVTVGANDKLHGLVNRNAFKTKPKSFVETITNYDTINVCVYNADPSVSNYFDCFLVQHGQENFKKDYQQLNGRSIQEANFEVKKLERKPISTNFIVTENSEYKGLKGVRIDFNYGLPFQYKRRNIRIKIMNGVHKAIDNIFIIKKERTQQENRIVGTYSYFISYYDLQNTQRVKLILTGNEKIIRQYESQLLNIEKTIEHRSIQQQVGHVHNGLSGILYQIDFKISKLPNEGSLKLVFPNLSKNTISKLLYWTAKDSNTIYKGTKSKLSFAKQQTIYVFLPYFVAPKLIHLTPQLLLETPDVPAIQLVQFDSKYYACPTSLNDIQIQAAGHQAHSFSGLTGQLFTFEFIVPDYYHSKGFFELQILENDQSMKKGLFVNMDANQGNVFPIHNQSVITIFIPYRFMKDAAKYSITLQAKSELFSLSEARTITFKNKLTIRTKGLYLQQINTKDWKEIVYKIGIRNDKNPNSTYEHLGYKIILEDTIKNNYKTDIPNAVNFKSALDDKLIIWIKEKNQPNDSALRFSTSIRALQEENGFLTIKNQGVLKKVIFKLVEKP